MDENGRRRAAGSGLDDHGAALPSNAGPDRPLSEHVSHVCFSAWIVYAIPAADAARTLLVKAAHVVGVEPGPAAGMIARRLRELDRARVRMRAWTERMPAADAAEGIKLFQAWHKSYHASVAAVILCDSCGQLHLHDPRFAAAYDRWRDAHRALRDVLAADREADPTIAARLVDQVRLRRQMAGAVLSFDDRRRPRAVLPAFLNGVRSVYLRAVLRGWNHGSGVASGEAIATDHGSATPVRRSLDRLLACERLTHAELSALETYVGVVRRTPPDYFGWAGAREADAGGPSLVQ